MRAVPIIWQYRYFLMYGGPEWNPNVASRYIRRKSGFCFKASMTVDFVLCCVKKFTTTMCPGASSSELNSQAGCLSSVKFPKEQKKSVANVGELSCFDHMTQRLGAKTRSCARSDGQGQGRSLAEGKALWIFSAREEGSGQIENLQMHVVWQHWNEECLVSKIWELTLILAPNRPHVQSDGPPNGGLDVQPFLSGFSEKLAPWSWLRRTLSR